MCNVIWIAKTAKVADTASITGPAIICDGAEIRHCAFIRGKAIVGAGAVVGNSTELKKKEKGAAYIIMYVTPNIYVASKLSDIKKAHCIS